MYVEPVVKLSQCVIKAVSNVGDVRYVPRVNALYEFCDSCAGVGLAAHARGHT